MDIAAGLSLLSQATGIVKDLRQIEKGYDAGALKAQMADLYATLADVKIALSDAREEIHERDQRIKKLEDQIQTITLGEACVICNEGQMKIVSSHPHPQFAFAGVLERTIKCTACGHTEKRLFDPEGRTKRAGSR